jgi:hypothetical protein
VSASTLASGASGGGGASFVGDLRPAAPAARGAAGADFGRAAEEDESLIGSSEGGSSRSLYLRERVGARLWRIAPENCAELRRIAPNWPE